MTANQKKKQSKINVGKLKSSTFMAAMTTALGVLAGGSMSLNVQAQTILAEFDEDGYIKADGVGTKIENGVVTIGGSINIDDSLIGVSAVDQWRDFYEKGATNPFKVNIDLEGKKDSVGVWVKQSENIEGGARVAFHRDVSIAAQTALQGNGTIVLENWDSDPKEIPTATIQGAIDMAEGTLTNINFSAKYVGDGVLGRYDSAQDSSYLALGEETENGQSAFLRVDTLNMAAGSIDIRGSKSTDQVLRRGSVLMAKTIVAESDPNEPDAIENSDQNLSPQIRVQGNGTLVLGTYLDRANSFIDGNWQDFDTYDEVTQMKTRLDTILTESNIMAGYGHEASLVIAGDYKELIPESVRIEVGSVTKTDAFNTDQSNILVGSDGRLIIYYDDEMRENLSRAYAEGTESLVVAGQGDAQLILYGWDGQELNLSMAGFEEKNFLTIGGVRGQWDSATGKVERLWCYKFAGLKSRDVVKHVELTQETTDNKALPGYAFLINSLKEEMVGKDIYANTVDGAVFLPVVDGTAAAFERAQSLAIDKIMSRDLSLFASQGHWWAMGWADHRKMPELINGGNGHWGVEADTTTGVLGYDFELAKNWIGGIALHAGGIDTESTGMISSMMADTSYGGVTLTAAYLNEDYGEIRLGVGYAKADTDSRYSPGNHTLETESSLEMITASALWRRTWNWMPFVVTPHIGLDANLAKMDEADIVDRSETVSGVGFKTQAEDRFWVNATVGADVQALFRVGEYTFVPELGLDVMAAWGDTDWEITSKLFDGKAKSKAAFHAGRDRAVRMSGAVTLASDGYKDEMTGGIFGFGAQATGKTLPYAWKLTLEGGYEYASDSEKTVYAGVNFRQLF